MHLQILINNSCLRVFSNSHPSPPLPPPLTSCNRCPHNTVSNKYDKAEMEFVPAPLQFDVSPNLGFLPEREPLVST